MQPADGDSYLQPFDLCRCAWTASARGRRAAVRGGARFDAGCRRLPRSARRVDLTLDVVFAGYGITAPEFGYDDYAGVDVRGKAVLVFDHEPQRGRSRLAVPRHRVHTARQRLDEDVDGPAPRGRRAAGGDRAGQRASHGAASSRSRQRAAAGARAGASCAFRVSRSASRGCSRPAEGHGPDGGGLAACDRRARCGRRRACSIGVTVRLQAVNQGGPASRRPGTSPGCCPAADPRLRDETILVTSHYDHLGVAGGKPYPGANDNGRERWRWWRWRACSPARARRAACCSCRSARKSS